MFITFRDIGSTIANTDKTLISAKPVLAFSMRDITADHPIAHSSAHVIEGLSLHANICAASDLDITISFAPFLRLGPPVRFTGRVGYMCELAAEKSRDNIHSLDSPSLVFKHYNNEMLGPDSKTNRWGRSISVRMRPRQSIEQLNCIEQGLGQCSTDAAEHHRIEPFEPSPHLAGIAGADIHVGSTLSTLKVRDISNS
jgi:hypothetical protein